MPRPTWRGSVDPHAAVDRLSAAHRCLARTPLPLLCVYGWITYLLTFHVFRWRRAQVAGDLA
jgi:hypothetical protein